jgi:hypothetical protein
VEAEAQALRQELIIFDLGSALSVESATFVQHGAGALYIYYMSFSADDPVGQARVAEQLGRIDGATSDPIFAGANC